MKTGQPLVMPAVDKRLMPQVTDRLLRIEESRRRLLGIDQPQRVEVAGDPVEGKIACAAIDVFDQEPLPPDHPFRSFPNLLATPHIGYVSRGVYERFHQDTVKNILQWLDSQVSR